MAYRTKRQYDSIFKYLKGLENEGSITNLKREEFKDEFKGHLDYYKESFDVQDAPPTFIFNRPGLDKAITIKFTTHRVKSGLTGFLYYMGLECTANSRSHIFLKLAKLQKLMEYKVFEQEKYQDHDLVFDRWGYLHKVLFRGTDKEVEID